MYIHTPKICPPQSSVVLYHIYISPVFPLLRDPFNMMLMMRYYNHLMLWVFLLFLLGCVMDESYASSLEGRDVPSEYSSSKGCKGRSNLYTTALLSTTLNKHDDKQKEEKKDECLDLDLGEPSEVLRTEGGVVRVWMEDDIDGAIRNVGVGLAELELEQDGLLLPNYANVAKVAYVLQGIIIITCDWLIYPIQQMMMYL